MFITAADGHSSAGENAPGAAIGKAAPRVERGLRPGDPIVPVADWVAYGGPEYFGSAVDFDHKASMRAESAAGTAMLLAVSWACLSGTFATDPPTGSPTTDQRSRGRRTPKQGREAASGVRVARRIIRQGG